MESREQVPSLRRFSISYILVHAWYPLEGGSRTWLQSRLRSYFQWSYQWRGECHSCSQCSGGGRRWFGWKHCKVASNTWSEEWIVSGVGLLHIIWNTIQWYVPERSRCFINLPRDWIMSRQRKEKEGKNGVVMTRFVSSLVKWEYLVYWGNDSLSTSYISSIYPSMVPPTLRKNSPIPNK